MNRERSEKVSFARMLGSIIGKGLGLKYQEVQPFIQDYAEEVFQLKYNYKYKTAKAKEIATRITQETEDQRLLAKVAAMTVK